MYRILYSPGTRYRNASYVPYNAPAHWWQSHNTSATHAGTPMGAACTWLRIFLCTVPSEYVSICRVLQGTTQHAVLYECTTAWKVATATTHDDAQILGMGHCQAALPPCTVWHVSD